MKKIKVCYVIGSLRIGGAERDLISLVENLDKNKYEFTIICLKESGPLEISALKSGAKVIALDLNMSRGLYHPLSYISLLKTIFKMYNIFKIEKPDIVHCFLFHAYVLGVITARLTRLPLKIITTRLSLGLFKDNKPFLQKLENFVNRYTDYIIVNSKAVADDVLEREKNVDLEKIRLIYNGVDIERLTEKSVYYFKKEKYGIPADSKVIGVVANLIAYKGHKDIIEAMPDILAECPDAYFFFVGQDRGIQKELKELAVKLDVKNHIVFTGLVEDIRTIMPIFDIYLSSSHEEGFSNSILEAMASGKAVIATNVGGNPEAIIDGQTGILIPPHNPDKLADAVINLLINDELRKSLAKNAYNFCRETFPRQKMVLETDKLYSEIIKNKINIK